MLLPPALVYAVGGLGVVALVGLVIHDRIAGARKWIARALVAVMVVAGGTTLVLLFGTTQVARVTEDHGVTVERSLLLGSTTTRLGDREVSLPWATGTTIVINEARRPVRLETIVYSRSDLAFASPDIVTIEALTVHVVQAKLDYLGPDDPPPEEFESKSSEETKYWLTW